MDRPLDSVTCFDLPMKNALMSLRADLVRDWEVDVLLRHLKGDGHVLPHITYVTVKETREARVRKLLDDLVKRPASAFWRFVSALFHPHVDQGHIALSILKKYKQHGGEIPEWAARLKREYRDRRRPASNAVARPQHPSTQQSRRPHTAHAHLSPPRHHHRQHQQGHSTQAPLSPSNRDQRQRLSTHALFCPSNRDHHQPHGTHASLSPSNHEQRQWHSAHAPLSPSNHDQDQWYSTYAPLSPSNHDRDQWYSTYAPLSPSNHDQDQWYSTYAPLSPSNHSQRQWQSTHVPLSPSSCDQQQRCSTHVLLSPSNCDQQRQCSTHAPLSQPSHHTQQQHFVYLPPYPPDHHQQQEQEQKGALALLQPSGTDFQLWQQQQQQQQQQQRQQQQQHQGAFCGPVLPPEFQTSSQGERVPRMPPPLCPTLPHTSSQPHQRQEAVGQDPLLLPQAEVPPTLSIIPRLPHPQPQLERQHQEPVEPPPPDDDEMPPARSFRSQLAERRSPLQPRNQQQQQPMEQQNQSEKFCSSTQQDEALPSTLSPEAQEQQQLQQQSHPHQEQQQRRGYRFGVLQGARGEMANSGDDSNVGDTSDVLCISAEGKPITTAEEDGRSFVTSRNGSGDHHDAFEHGGAVGAIGTTATWPRSPVQITDTNVYWDKRHADQNGVYRMESRPRGAALIINNRDFHHLTHRDGTDRDRDSLADLFRHHLGFDVDVRDNLTAQGMKKALTDFLERLARRRAPVDACMVAIFTHGARGDVLFGVDGTLTGGKPRKGTYITTDYLREVFGTTSCPVMAGKPKLFILQACRGGYSTDAEDGRGGRRCLPHDVLNEGDVVLNPVADLPDKGDVLFLYATLSRYVAYRNHFIPKLVEVFRHHARSKHLLELQTQVCQEVKEYNAHTFTTAEGSSTLSKTWYLNPPGPSLT